jgi:hypothetical protein
MQVKLNRTRIINGTIAGTAKATVKVTKTPTSKGKFTNKKGVGKVKARKIMVDAITAIKLNNNFILTLPSDTCQIERDLLVQSKKFTFLGVEKDTDTYWAMVTKILKYRLPITAFNGTMGAKIAEAKTNQYGHLILDYCGQLPTFSDEIMLALRNNIVEVNGTISITLNKRLSGEEGRNFANFLLKLNPQNDFKICEYEHLVRTFINRIGGYNYAIEKVFSYNDTNAMILVILRRIA